MRLPHPAGSLASEDMTDSDNTGDADRLAMGLVLYRGRMARGLSMRAISRRLGLSAHSAVAEYEKGGRIPPEYVLEAYERVFELPAGTLHRLRRRVLEQHADRQLNHRIAGTAGDRAPQLSALVAAQLRELTGSDTACD